MKTHYLILVIVIIGLFEIGAGCTMSIIDGFTSTQPLKIALIGCLTIIVAVIYTLLYGAIKDSRERR